MRRPVCCRRSRNCFGTAFGVDYLLDVHNEGGIALDDRGNAVWVEGYRELGTLGSGVHPTVQIRHRNMALS